MHRPIGSRAVLASCAVLLCAGFATEAGAELSVARTLACAGPSERHRAEVDVAWVAREREALRNYRLTVVQEGPAGASTECSLDVPPQGSAAGTSLYSVTVLVAPDAHLRLRLHAVPQVGPPLVLAERDVVAFDSRLHRGPTPREEGPLGAFACSATGPAAGTELDRAAFHPPPSAPAGWHRPATWTSVFTLGTSEQRGPPAQASL